jgi:ketol-acid reductoisomerase
LPLQEHDVNEEIVKPEEDGKTEKMQNEMAEKLDTLMNLMFEYIRKTCYDEGISSKINKSNTLIFFQLSNILIFFLKQAPTTWMLRLICLTSCWR